MINLIEKVTKEKGPVSLPSLYYFWWNNNEKKVYLTEELPPKHIVVTIRESGWSNHGLRLRSYNEIHEDYFHFHQYHEDRVITIFKDVISKSEIERIASIRRTLESH